MWTIQPRGLGDLLEALRNRGYRVVGPVVRDGAICYEDLGSIEDLALAWLDEQEPGNYRLTGSGNGDLFSYSPGAHTWKKFLHKPSVTLWRATKDQKGLHLKEEPTAEGKVALFGARPCELAAIAIQDRVFLEGPFVDSFYAAARKEMFVVALNCSHPSKSCFCVSMKTGPRAATGFDLCLTEIHPNGEAELVVEVGSETGGLILADLQRREATEKDLEAVRKTLEEAEQRVERSLDTEGIQGLFDRSFESPQWDDVARRCLGCANCTMVCPTCFCTEMEDITDLTGDHAERWQRWDSCFHGQFTHVHGGPVRQSTRSRYRQWLTHKLASWEDQFGTTGCVGCGRCIAWCPAGIDLTAEVKAFRESEHSQEKNKR
ncbi:MAG: 4Fe-4S dicluster domain-containing protein [Candidatus Omnitrophica bacterium]|nr:4Fe-4S dicluster domain-containing protein [Candidatus Omnitrophota bacterium]